MASPDTFPDKHPAVNRIYGIDWVPDLPAGEIVGASAWVITGPDGNLTKSNEAKSNDKTSLWLAGGTLGAQYMITNTITKAPSGQTLVSVKRVNIRST
jgi:hypothetical protein